MIHEAKLARGVCVDCGLSVTVDNVVVFDFDHRDRSLKLAEVGRLVKQPHALETELEKCDLRCSNCHRLKTHRNRDWGPRSVTRIEPTDVLF